MSEQVQQTIDTAHKPTLNPSSGALRDAWLRSFSENAVVGRLYGEGGAVISKGMSPMAWLTKLRVLDPGKKFHTLSPEELQAVWIELAYNYNTAASFHANYTLVAKALAGEVEGVESEFIGKEISEYKPGGKHWDAVLKKAPRAPGKEVLERLARVHTSTARKELRWYNIQAEFFYNIMMNLETQRRCLKDYNEMARADPSNRGF
jgi:hypothetical protein